jgi:hypothetical protein
MIAMQHNGVAFDGRRTGPLAFSFITLRPTGRS